MPEKYDLIIRNGRVIDPASNTDHRADVGIRNSKIACIQENLDGQAEQAVDAEGKIVCPGLIDIHTHLYAKVTTWGIDADPTCLAKGVTTAVDAGSASWVTFPGFRELSISRSQGRVLCYIHISGLGLVYGPIAEMADIRYACPEETAECVLENSDVALGIKVRQGAAQVEKNGVEPLKHAIKAAELSNTHVMTHLGGGVPIDDVLNLMRAGDIATHCFHCRSDTILGEDGQIQDVVHQARDRGVLFDVGHGGGSFGFETARAAFEQHFLPDVISSDLHTLSHGGPVFDLLTTMTKFLVLGMPVGTVIEKTTSGPAKAIRREESLGSLAIGREADIAILEEQEGEFELMDTRGDTVKCDKSLACAGVVRAGNLVDTALWHDYVPRMPKAIEWQAVPGLRKTRPGIFEKVKHKLNLAALE
ncbi:MAG: amidohydrolase/deacetylase family metallohydrolase [Planctomycetota bacterium]|jgi:dihydroorotase|nr:amidohydrolase/deacetylase family metallohydrolase [Planctomycetota bacterium]MDP7131508.1 amidohydrolase/deacetylase family metallohydrolase [Planctomycetota bacterium]